MSDHRYYVSVMTPAASSGNLTFQLDTFDAETNIVALVCTITGITAGMNEINQAILIQAQLTEQIPAYSGTPSFSAEPYQATFRMTRTEHVVCLWSQAQFQLQELTNATGANYKLSDVGCLATCARAAALNGAFDGSSGFVTLSGITLTVQQTVDLIETISAEVVGYLNDNNLIISTYLGEWSTNGTKAIFTSPCPGLSIDQPLIRRKNLYEMYSIPQYSALAYDWIRHSGKLVFRFNQNFVNAGEPFELDNEVRVTFVAGHFVIPTAVQRCIQALAKFGLVNNQGLDEIGGGSFKAHFRKYAENLEYYFRPIKHLKSKRML